MESFFEASWGQKATNAATIKPYPTRDMVLTWIFEEEFWNLCATEIWFTSNVMRKDTKWCENHVEQMWKDENFFCPYGQRVSGLVSDNYALSPLSRVLVMACLRASAVIVLLRCVWEVVLTSFLRLQLKPRRFSFLLLFSLPLSSSPRLYERRPNA